MFLMDNGGRFRTDYLAGHPSLAGRVLFTNAYPGQPDAALSSATTRRARTSPRYRISSGQGYVVRTRADADTVQARTGDTTMPDAAFASGAQWVSTDYPVPGRSARFGTTISSICRSGSGPLRSDQHRPALQGRVDRTFRYVRRVQALPNRSLHTASACACLIEFAELTAS